MGVRAARVGSGTEARTPPLAPETDTRRNRGPGNECLGGCRCGKDEGIVSYFDLLGDRDVGRKEDLTELGGERFKR